MNQIKKYFFILLLLEMFFAYAPAYAQTTPAAQTPTAQYGDTTGTCQPDGPGVCSQIAKYLCTPNSPNVSGSTSGVLFSCINQIYKFAIVVAAVVGVFFIVIAGYIYMSADGSQESVDKAKDILVSTLTALVILFVGYVLLAALNPDLVKFNTIQPPNVPLPTQTAPPSPVSTTGTTGTGTGTCPNCVDLASSGIPTNGASISVQPTVLAYLQSMKSQAVLSGVNWYVTSGYDYRAATTDCHNSGACADVSVNPKSDASWSSLCQAAQAAGFSTILNEASATASQCPAYKTYASTNGANIHLQP